VDYQQMCPRYEKAIDVLGKKWTGLIIRILMGGKKRFGEFHAQMPDVSDRLLSERLKTLEDEGVIIRRVFDTKPVRVEYELTAKGRALEPVVTAIQAWGEHWCEPETVHSDR
jgi:DNA-binding HxlR family transcriptional regulator